MEVFSYMTRTYRQLFILLTPLFCSACFTLMTEFEEKERVSNESFDTASTLDEGTHEVRVFPQTYRFYKVLNCPSGTLIAHLEYPGEQGQLDLLLYSADKLDTPIDTDTALLLPPPMTAIRTVSTINDMVEGSEFLIQIAPLNNGPAGIPSDQAIDAELRVTLKGCNGEDEGDVAGTDLVEEEILGGMFTTADELSGGDDF